MTSKVLVTGSAGFIGGYVVEELLGRGYEVVGVDNYSKYGPVAKSYDDHPAYTARRRRRARRRPDDRRCSTDCDHFIAGAALIGGISYFHAYAYDLLATNERIMAVLVRRRDRRAPRRAAAEGHLHELVDGVRVDRPWPSYEGHEREIPPPLSSYGFQKLAVEYFARAAWDQYGLPYTIVRPFNCVGIGEGRALGDVEIC